MRNWHELTPGVRVCHSEVDMTATVTAESAVGLLLVDPAWLPTELATLADDLADTPVACGFATHAHYDHLLWHPRLGQRPRLASPGTVQLAAEDRAALIAGLGPDWPAELAALVGQVQPVDDALATWGEPIEHDGHCRGHTALYLTRPRVLVAGDMCSDTEIPLLDPDGVDPLGDYMRALETLRPYLAQAAVLIPGHGRPSWHPVDRYDADCRYLEALHNSTVPADPRLVSSANHQAHQLNVRLAHPKAD